MGHTAHTPDCDALVKALEVCTKWIVDLAESGDAGFWDPEKMPEIIQARAALALAQSQGKDSTHAL